MNLGISYIESVYAVGFILITLNSFSTIMLCYNSTKQYWEKKKDKKITYDHGSPDEHYESVCSCFLVKQSHVNPLNSVRPDHLCGRIGGEK